jgi:glutamate synthase (NADPH/NADH) small chain
MGHETKTKPQLEAEAQALLKPLLDRKAAGEKIGPKDRMAIPSQEMSAQAPLVRGKNMNEVALGLAKARPGLRRNAVWAARMNPALRAARFKFLFPNSLRKFKKGTSRPQWILLKKPICCRRSVAGCAPRSLSARPNVPWEKA